jgi:poly(beta-D-mannuronate) lyase
MSVRLLIINLMAAVIAACGSQSVTSSPETVIPDSSQSPAPAPTPAPNPTPTDRGIAIPEASVSASTYDDRCDCAPGNAVDGDFATRWSGQGDGAQITFDLGAPHTVEYMKIAWHRGNERVATFDVLMADASGGPWTAALTGKTSSGTTTGLEQYDFADINARYVRIVGHGNSAGDGWNSILEAQVFGNPVAQAAAPIFDPPGGAYASGPLVALSSATGGAEIRYTMDGSNPSSTQGTLYTGPIVVTATTTIKAVAIKSGIASSGVASATYTVVTGTGATGLDPLAPPSDNFDLAKWKLTIPSGSDISVSTLNGGYILANAFFTDPVTGGMVFRCPNIAGTTSGSSYSRTELREMLDESAGTTNLGNNWVLGTSSTSAKAAAAGVDGTMNATLTVDHVSTTGDSAKVGRVVVGQIHGPDTEIIRLYFHKRPSDAKGAIYFGHDTPSNSNTYYPIIGDPANLDPAGGIALGERWSYEIKVVGQTLIVSVTPDGRPTVTTSLPIETGYNDQYLYYKAGVYNQNNTGDSGDYVQATFYSLTHTHP